MFENGGSGTNFNFFLYSDHIFPITTRMISSTEVGIEKISF